MDPDAALAEIRRLIAAVNLALEDPDPNVGAALGERLADQIADLDEWIGKGGLLPSAWMAGTRRVVPWGNG